MSKHTINVLFWLYKSRLDKNGMAPIYLRITYQKQRKNVSTGFSIPNKDWDKVKGKVKKNIQNAVQINSYMVHTKSTVIELFNEMINDRGVDLNLLVSRLFGKDEVEKTLLSLVRFHNDDFKARVGLDLLIPRLRNMIFFAKNWKRLFYISTKERMFG